MIFGQTSISQVFIISPERIEDERGHFNRTFDAEVFSRMGIDRSVAECSSSYNERAGTLRGMHFQHHPYMETKLVRCTRGRIWDVVADLRASSISFGKWTSAELSAENGRAMVVPPGCAHGFLTLEPSSEVAYQISVPHHHEASAGFRFDDLQIGIEWPEPPVVISPRDQELPSFSEIEYPSLGEHTS